MSNPHFSDRSDHKLRDIGNLQSNSSEKKGEEKSIEGLMTVINQLRQCGGLKKALKQSDVLIAKHPQLVRGLQVKGEITFSLHQYQQSLSCYLSSLALIDSPENRKNTAEPQQRRKRRALYQYNCGLCLQKLERHEEAITALKEAAQGNKLKIETYFALAQSYSKIGQMNKAMQIFEKLAQKTKGNSQVMEKIISSLLASKDYESGLQLADRELLCMKGDIKNHSHFMMLLSAKAKSLRNLGRYEAAISVYLQVTIAAQEQGQVIDAYFRLADCYQKIGRTGEAAECYQRILKAKPESLEALNNLANLQIRQKKYAEAALLLDSALTLSKEQKFPTSQIKVLILKSHRIVALMHIGKRDEAARDLKEVLHILSKEESFGKEEENIKNNFRFIKDVVGKYKQTLGKLDDLQRETANSKLPSQLNEEARTVSNLLMSSIACELESKCTQHDELERLSQRINKLHREILDFKLNTMKEHEISQTRVHDKIQEIEGILEKKEEEANKLALEMEDLKKEYADLYGMISQINTIDHKGSLAKAIKNAKESGKPLVALYAQEMYWIFSAYLISIRLVANHLVGQGKHLVHLKGISSFFARFKSIFEVASQIPHIGSVCEAINSLLSLYLNQESSFVYSQLNKAITRTFISEKELQAGLEAAVLNLLKTDYIDQALEKSKKDKIQSQMTLQNRALSWFHKQRTKLIKKFVQFQEETADEILVKEQVIEDIGSVLLYIIRNKGSSSSEPNPKLLEDSLLKALSGDFKEGQVNSLYYKEQSKQNQTKGHEGGCSSKCQVY